MRPALLSLLLLVIGCEGFHVLDEPDLGTDAGSDDAAAGGDAASRDLSSEDARGPGPLGALPSGYCCDRDSECRGRNCAQFGASAHYCSDWCATNDVCVEDGLGNYCELSVGWCQRISGTSSCASQSTYETGGKATGACCNAAATLRGNECLGGWCLVTGAASNPAYCSQGCAGAPGDCPSGYSCVMPNRQCWKSNTVGQPNAVTTCD